MKTEQIQLAECLEIILVCAIFACLWAIGGSQDFWGGQKWIRRFLAPFAFCLWAYIRSGLNWRYLVQMPLMMGAFTLPYGADSIGMKWLLRSVCGLAYGASSSIVNLWRKEWLLGITQIFVTLSISVIAGVYNPFANAIREQFVIGFFVVLIPAISVTRENQ